MRAVVLILIFILASNCDDDESPKCPNPKTGGLMDLGQRWIHDGFIRECVTFENGTAKGVKAAIVACLSNYYQEIPINTEMTIRGKTYKCNKDPKTGAFALTQIR
ncbi:hypothetical protein Aduo_006092 [Ancylostoma duodenale]